MSISKKIHYCWFGNGELSSEAKESIKSWKKYLPEYELVLWNEENFDIRSNKFVSEAYDAKKYAYVTDYVRLYVLNKLGGIYFDTDVEVLKSFDDLLNFKAFAGYEGNKLLGTGIIGAIKNHPWIGRLLKEYDEKDFLLKDGRYNDVPNSVLVSEITLLYFGWKDTNTYQVLDHDINIFQSDVFSAKDSNTGKLFANENTYSIHHFG
ncbi:MAG: glycosyltransferase [Spirochaetaceae bacterium]